jgi:hypothetical protein
MASLAEIISNLCKLHVDGNETKGEAKDFFSDQFKRNYRDWSRGTIALVRDQSFRATKIQQN